MGRFRTENSIFIAGKSMEIGREEGRKEWYEMRQERHVAHIKYLGFYLQVIEQPIKSFEQKLQNQISVFKRLLRPSVRNG